MVKFTFNFLLGIPNDSDGQASEPDGENCATTEYKVGQPNFLCHLEYVLAPEEPPRWVDVVCWERAAKIYAEDESSAEVPLAVGRIRWIFFRTEHEVVVADEAVPDYQRHNVAVTASLDGRKFCPAAKSEKVRLFYGRTVPGGTTLFPALWEDPAEIGNPTRGCVVSTDFESCEVSKKLRGIVEELSEEYNVGDAVRKPTIAGREEPPWRILGEEPQEKVQETGKPEKKAKEAKEATTKSKAELSKEVTFVISGESILSGLKILENHAKYAAEELPFLVSVLQVRDVLTYEQAGRFNPFSITLKRVKFLPVQTLQEEKIRSIRFNFVVCDSYEAESSEVEMAENLDLNYTRTILTDRISTPELVEFIQTKGLKVKVVGIRGGDAEETKPSMFKDQRINSRSGLPGTGKKRQRRKGGAEQLLLGVANVDISSILLEPHRLSVQYNFSCQVSPQNRATGREPPRFLCTPNPTEVNSRRPAKAGGLSHVLATSHAVLSLSIRLASSVWRHFSTITPFMNMRNRIFIAVNDVYTAMTVLKKIQTQNELFAPTDYSKGATRLERPLSAYHEINVRTTDSDRLYLTGFFIDCVEYFLIYVEGPGFGVLREIWSIASFIEPSIGRVLYDSSLMFGGVYHRELISHGGFYIISLRRSPTALLCDRNAYREGNIPMPAYRALLQLHQLCHCPSITTAVQNELIPDYHSLLSLDLEFGVPWKISNTVP